VREIFLVTPNMGWLCTPLVQRVMIWLQRYSMEWFSEPSGLKPFGYMRNYWVERFLENGAEWLATVDADTIPPPDALDKMFAAGVDVVLAKVRTMKLDDDGIVKPVGTLVERRDGAFYEADGNGLRTIDRGGLACALIRRKVFEAISPPWFEEMSWGDSRDADFNFCEKLEKAGIPLYGHFDVVCRHRKEWDL